MQIFEKPQKGPPEITLRRVPAGNVFHTEAHTAKYKTLEGRIPSAKDYFIRINCEQLVKNLSSEEGADWSATYIRSLFRSHTLVLNLNKARLEWLVATTPVYCHDASIEIDTAVKKVLPLNIPITEDNIDD